MPDEKESKESPSFDPHKLLRAAERIVLKHRDESGRSNILGTLIIVAVVLGAVAIYSWVSWRRGRELAKLRHEAKKRSVALENERVLHEMGELKKSLDVNQQRLDEAEERYRLAEAELKLEEGRYAADRAAIDRIRSWRDAGVEFGR